MLDRTPTNRLHADHLPSGQPRPSPAPDKVLLDAYSHAVTSVVDRIGPAVDQMTEFVLAGLGCRTQIPPPQPSRGLKRIMSVTPLEPR